MKGLGTFAIKRTQEDYNGPRSMAEVNEEGNIARYEVYTVSISDLNASIPCRRTKQLRTRKEGYR